MRPDAEQALRNAVDTGYKRSYPDLADSWLWFVFTKVIYF